MIASKFVYILIGLLAHISNHCAQSQTSWACGFGSMTRINCEAAYKNIQYTKGGITGGETKIIANYLDCRVFVISNNKGAVMQQDVESAFGELFDSCPSDKYSGGYNSKAFFTVKAFFVSPLDIPFGSNMQLGNPTCKKSLFFSKIGLIKPEDCISAISTLKAPKKGTEGLVYYQPDYPKLLVGGYKTCFIAVNPINDLTVNLDPKTLKNMLQTISGTCKQDKGMVLNKGGSFGLNSKIFIETGFRNA